MDKSTTVLHLGAGVQGAGTEEGRAVSHEAQRLSELRIVLLGERVAGKSSAGNTILGRKEFVSCRGTEQSVRRQGEVAGRQVTVVDTPGWFTLKETPAQITQEIVRSVSLCPPGPHAILLVNPVRVDYERHRTSAKEHLELLGETAWRHTLLLFTWGDRLGDTALEQHIQTGGQDLRWLLQKCGNRYHVLNNQNTQDSTQVTELLEKIEQLRWEEEESTADEVDLKCKEERERGEERQNHDERPREREEEWKDKRREEKLKMKEKQEEKEEALGEEEEKLETIQLREEERKDKRREEKQEIKEAELKAEEGALREEGAELEEEEAGLEEEGVGLKAEEGVLREEGVELEEEGVGLKAEEGVLREEGVELEEEEAVLEEEGVGLKAEEGVLKEGGAELEEEEAGLEEEGVGLKAEEGVLREEGVELEEEEAVLVEKGVGLKAEEGALREEEEAELEEEEVKLETKQWREEVLAEERDGHNHSTDQWDPLYRSREPGVRGAVERVERCREQRWVMPAAVALGAGIGAAIAGISGAPGGLWPAVLGSLFGAAAGALLGALAGLGRAVRRERQPEPCWGR